MDPTSVPVKQPTKKTHQCFYIQIHKNCLQHKASLFAFHTVSLLYISHTAIYFLIIKKNLLFLRKFWLHSIVPKINL